MDNGVFFPRLQADHSPSSSAELKNAWSNTSTTPKYRNCSVISYAQLQITRCNLLQSTLLFHSFFLCHFFLSYCSLCPFLLTTALLVFIPTFSSLYLSLLFWCAYFHSRLFFLCVSSLLFSFFCSNSPPPPPTKWARATSFTRFLDHTQRRTTVGSTPLYERSARRRELYLTTHNTHNKQTSMPPVGIEPAISAGGKPQTYSLRPRGHRDGPSPIYATYLLHFYFIINQEINITIRPCLRGIPTHFRAHVTCSNHLSEQLYTKTGNATLDLHAGTDRPNFLSRNFYPL